MTTNYSRHFDGSAAAAAWRAQVVANVSLVKNHSALLGYYICDDCCPTNGSLEDVALMAQLCVAAFHLHTSESESGLSTL